MSTTRTRWAAIGAAVAVTLGAGGIGLVGATSPAGAVAYVPITPCRLIDTRPESTVGTRVGRLGANEAATFDSYGAVGECTQIPAAATGLSLNVTATNATSPTFLTIYPNDQTRPSASSLNPVPGAPATPNAVITDLSPGGRFAIYNFAGTVHVIVDVNGYFVDHDHDDRYHTEAEIDTRTALTPFAGGFVASDAAVGRNVNVVSATWAPGVHAKGGRYEIQLRNPDGSLVDFSVADFATSVIPNCPGADASTNDGGIADTRLYVYIEITGSTDTLGQCGFSFTVTKLPPAGI
jgi:hypothetical protein